MSRPYPEYRDSGDVWLGALPSHWEVRRLKQVADAYVRDMERIILSATASPMNLVRPTPSEFTKALHEHRRGFREQVTKAWPEIIRPTIRRRRR